MKTRYKWIICGVVVLLVGGYLIVSSQNTPEAVQTEQLVAQDLNRTVLATGTVTSSVDLDLGFKMSGIVKRIPAKVGQKVGEGTILIQLDQADQLATVAQARAAVASAQANLNKVNAGATSEEVAVAQVVLDNATQALNDTRKQQDVLVRNARQNYLSTSLVATPGAGNLSSITPTVTGAYTGTNSATYTLTIVQTGSGWRYEVSGADGVSGFVSVNTPLLATKTGLFITFSQAPTYPSDSWTIEVPNTKSASYVANLNAYNAALEAQRSAISAAESSVRNAEASLALKKAQARPADVAAAEASVLSAKAQLAAANAQLENTIIRSPSKGTITKIDIKVGEQATALKPVVVVQDVGSLYVEANVSEANIAQVKPGQKVTYTFDALGSDREFSGTVTAIDPASTVVSGVVNYKITASVDNVADVKPGMTANMSVLIAELDNVLAVPQRSIVEENGKKYVRVITDEKKQLYEKREVQTGLSADGGLIEIKTGLSSGQTIVTFIEEKK